MSNHARIVLLASLLVVGCGSSPPATPDSGPGEGDAGTLVPALQWTRGPDFPFGVAFGAAMVLPANGSWYVYAFGGASGSFVDLGGFHSEVRRAEIQADHSLGEWEDAGTMSTGTSSIPLAGHRAIRVRSEMSEDGVAIAGGGTPTSSLPLILVGYVDPLTASITSWGRWTPMLETTPDEGQWFASWDAFEPHHFALVGGTIDGVPTDHVRIALIENGAMSMTFLPGPSLPSARFGHASLVVDGEVYVIGGASVDGALTEVLRTTRDGEGHVDGWAMAGELTSRVVFPGAAAAGNDIYVIGGIAGDPATGSASARVLSGTIDASGDVGTVSVLEEAALPEPLAGSLVAVDAGYVYVIGGIASGSSSGGQHTYWMRLP